MFLGRQGVCSVMWVAGFGWTPAGEEGEGRGERERPKVEVVEM